MTGDHSNARFNGSCTNHALFTQDSPGNFDLIKTGGVEDNDLTNGRGLVQADLRKRNNLFTQLV